MARAHGESECSHCDADITGAPAMAEVGEPWPLGAHACCDGTNFAVFSRHAAQVELWIFDDADAAAPSQRAPMYRTGDIWHARLPGNLRGKCYALRAIPPERAGPGAYFDAHVLLLDPYAQLVEPRSCLDVRLAAHSSEHLRCRALARIPRSSFDWQGVRAPRRAWADTVIYEVHVRGFTRHGSSQVRHPGEYLGMIEKIPYLQSLGVTAVELLPVQAFEMQYVPDRAAGLVQYWGYNPIALFAAHPAYSSGSNADAAMTELKTLVRELHRADIEVILDVVFNHTGEAGAEGPVYSFRGLDNEIYYMLSADGTRNLDFTGCGNTLNGNHPVVRSMILDCLRYWATEFRIDGFRFDLAAVLGRDRTGELLSNAPLLESIAEDPLLRDVKLVAEAWDAGGAFQVGHFGSARWGEWNCHFRDDVRRFWRGDARWSGRLATRLCGSSDLYARDGATPLKSVNFLTSHDGFTLHDLVSYSRKHNEANGEGGRDGANENASFNHGVEGETTDPAILALRKRQMRNMLTVLLLSRGVPMLLGGDEFARTQRGNNNAYCQDNDLSWYDWNRTWKNADLVEFVRRLIDFRRKHPVLRADRFYTDAEIIWLGSDGQPPDWQGRKNQFGCVISDGDATIAMLFNAEGDPCDFRLPPTPGPWKIAFDTADESTRPLAAFAYVHDETVGCQPHSALVLTTGTVT